MAQKPDFVFPLNGQVRLNRWGRQFSRLLAAEVCASTWVMLDRPRSEMAWEYWLPTPFASFPFTSPPMRHRVPPGSERALPHITLLDKQSWKHTRNNVVKRKHKLQKWLIHLKKTKTDIIFVKCEVLMAMTMKNTVLECDTAQTCLHWSRFLWKVGHLSHYMMLHPTRLQSPNAAQFVKKFPAFT